MPGSSRSKESYSYYLLGTCRCRKHYYWFQGPTVHCHVPVIRKAIGLLTCACSDVWLSSTTSHLVLKQPSSLQFHVPKGTRIRIFWTVLLFYFFAFPTSTYIRLQSVADPYPDPSLSIPTTTTLYPSLPYFSSPADAIDPISLSQPVRSDQIRSLKEKGFFCLRLFIPPY